MLYLMIFNWNVQVIKICDTVLLVFSWAVYIIENKDR